MYGSVNYRPPTSLGRNTASTTVLHWWYLHNGHAGYHTMLFQSGVSGLVVDIWLWLKGSQSISKPLMLAPGVKRLAGPDSVWMGIRREKKLEIEAEAKRKPANRVGPWQTKPMYKVKWLASKILCKKRKFSSREKKTEQARV